ncbi:uncharacterized protein RSE6_01041 [Rhynchosporium secalis]|uniref:AB hydrolase-1 domain-containing protein n=1 Tax=Rhynchosporium secalis TaxID=38038 RepID=A0A1E1LWT3_RHYSE|nr:uncharacterized protein RSE6_01041 [Rhynchosporium secalis]
MATTNPLADSDNSARHVSSKSICIAGIDTEIFGLDELSPNTNLVSCIWLLHPRLQAKEIMAGVAASCINMWNQNPEPDKCVGLIAVAFDQRNHGGRKVQDLANQAWREGNATHAQDMFSIYHGTALDTSLLIDHLGSYIFLGPDDPAVTQHLVMGISLGGHAAWQVLFNEPRVTAGVVIIGCPDYMNIMTDRARLSKLPDYVSSSPPGSRFLGSPSFPSSLLSALEKCDPRALLFSSTPIPPTSSITPSQKSQLATKLNRCLAKKSVLVCSGGADKLVPYSSSAPFLTFLKEATDKETGWWKEGGCVVDDRVYEGVGHAYSEGMAKDTVAFVRGILEKEVKSRGGKEKEGSRL